MTQDHNNQDHDLLVQINEKLSNFIERFERHDEEDKDRFKVEQEARKVVKDKTDRHEKVLWVVGGVVLAVEALPRIVEFLNSLPTTGG